MAPERIIAIGGGGILGNLADRIVPMLAVGMTPSCLEITCGTYQTLGRRLNEADMKLLSRMGYTSKHVIECVFTSGLKPQKEHVTRAEIGWKDDDFVIAVVGGRLDYEVTEELLQMFSGVLKPDMHVAFMGFFETYEERLKDFPEIRAQSSVQFCKDILSRMELCDLYVNPMRRGGGLPVWRPCLRVFRLCRSISGTSR
jgi:hypothetical protein